MRFFCISDNVDTYTGMQLAGIEGVVVHEINELQQQLSILLKNKDIGVILMTKKLINLCHNDIVNYKLSLKRPLIVEIPDRHSCSNIGDSISRYIRESVGITI